VCEVTCGHNVGCGGELASSPRRLRRPATDPGLRACEGGVGEEKLPPAPSRPLITFAQTPEFQALPKVGGGSHLSGPIHIFGEGALPF